MPEKPKRRGRPKGSVNKTNRVAKEAIVAAEPHSFLIKIMEGRKFMRAGTEGAQRRTACYPTLSESVSAAETLLRKISPDLKAMELGGIAGGDPITIRQQQEWADDPRETARRICTILSHAGIEGHEVAPEARRETQAAPKAQDTLDGADPAPAAPESFAGPPEPPSEGKSLWLGGVELRYLSPDRAGLPPLYGVFEGGLQLRRGSFETCLALIKQRVGEPLPPGKVTATVAGEPDARMAPQRDQLPPEPPGPRVLHRRPRTGDR